MTIAICLTMSVAFAAVEKDTVSINQSAITKVIEEPCVSKNGKPYTKYFVIIDGELVATNKSVVEKLALAKKYGTKCNLAAVRNRNTKSLIRIILN